jgi:hypothetical protein
MQLILSNFGERSKPMEILKFSKYLFIVTIQVFT